MFENSHKFQVICETWRRCPLESRWRFVVSWIVSNCILQHSEPVFPLRRYGHSMIIRWRSAAIMDWIEPEIATFGSPSRRPRKPYFNQTWSGSDDPLRRHGRSKFDLSWGCISDPILREGEVVRGSSWKERWWFSIGSPLWPYVFDHSAAICHRMSATPKSTWGWVTLRQTSERKCLTPVSKILTRSRRYMGASYIKEIESTFSAVWAQCTNMKDRQTTER